MIISNEKGLLLSVRMATPCLVEATPSDKKGVALLSRLLTGGKITAFPGTELSVIYPYIISVWVNQCGVFPFYDGPYLLQFGNYRAVSQRLLLSSGSLCEVFGCYEQFGYIRYFSNFCAFKIA